MHMPSCSVFQDLLHNMLFSNKVVNPKSHSLIHKSTTNVLVQFHFVFNQSSSSCCSHFDTMSLRLYFTINSTWALQKLKWDVLTGNMFDKSLSCSHIMINPLLLTAHNLNELWNWHIRPEKCKVWKWSFWGYTKKKNQ